MRVLLSVNPFAGLLLNGLVRHMELVFSRISPRRLVWEGDSIS
jgi:hypothetical protein